MLFAFTNAFHASQRMQSDVASVEVAGVDGALRVGASSAIAAEDAVVQVDHVLDAGQLRKQLHQLWQQNFTGDDTKNLQRKNECNVRDFLSANVENRIQA